MQILPTNPLVFYEEGVTTPATVFANSKTYYAEIPLNGAARASSVQVDHDATLVAAVDIQYSNKPAANVYAAAGRVWGASGITQVVINAAAGNSVMQIPNNVGARARVKIAITTATAAGVLSGFLATAHHKS